jgi:hypothetical protein
MWMLQSSGLMGAKKIESYNRPVTPDIESVGQFYIKMLKGYVGISTIIAYALILIQFLSASSEFQNILMIVFVDPILIVMFSLPIALIIEIRASKINERMEKYYRKLNIDTIPKIIKIEELEEKEAEDIKKQIVVTKRQESEIIEKLKEMLEVSNRINLDMMRKVLRIDEDQFNDKIFAWAKEFQFKIDGDFIIIDKDAISDFLNALDKQFADWEQFEDRGNGKI